ncbi:unnamed protein product [Ectocarpus sp. 12 AP-2014]
MWCPFQTVQRVLVGPLEQQQRHDLRCHLSSTSVERCAASRILGGDRCSILQQVIHDFFMNASSGRIQGNPHLCTCARQLPCELFVALAGGTLERSPQQLPLLFWC